MGFSLEISVLWITFHLAHLMMYRDHPAFSWLSLLFSFRVRSWQLGGRGRLWGLSVVGSLQGSCREPNICHGSSQCHHMEVFALGWLFSTKMILPISCPAWGPCGEMPNYFRHASGLGWGLHRQPLLISLFAIWHSTAVSASCCLCVLSSAINYVQEINLQSPV